MFFFCWCIWVYLYNGLPASLPASLAVYLPSGLPVYLPANLPICVLANLLSIRQLVSRSMGFSVIRLVVNLSVNFGSVDP